MAKAQVCMLTTEHSAMDVRIFYKEARSLAKAGYQVSILSPMRNGSVVGMGAKALDTSHTTVDDVELIGYVPHYSKWQRARVAVRWLKLWSGGTIDLLRSYDELIDKAVALQADVYHAHEIDSLCVAFHVERLLARQGKKTKIVYDIHEFTPSGAEGIKNRYIRSVYRGLIVKFERSALERVDYTFTVNEMIRDFFKELSPTSAIEILYNISSAELPKLEKNSDKISQQVTITYLGSARMDRGFDQFVEIAKTLKQSYGTRVHLLLIGNLQGAEKEYFDVKAQEYDITDMISVTGWMKREEIGSALLKADIGLIFVFRQSNMTVSMNTIMSTPNKLFDYMEYGIPIVSAEIPEITRILNETGAGISVPDQVEDFCTGIATLIENPKLRMRMGCNGRRAAEGSYSFAEMEQRLLKGYIKVLESKVSKI